MTTQPTQSVVSLPLAPSVRRALLCAGLSTVMDIRNLPAHELMQVTGLPEELASEVLQLALGQPEPGWRLAGAVTAAELLAVAGSNTEHRGIQTGCRGLDDLLGGAGVACGTVTEFYGVPGVGKTQVGMQLAVNVQVPKAFGGLGGQALYIDTEGSFMTDRLIDLASGAVQRVQTVAAAAEGVQQTDAAAQAAQSFTVESILSGVLYMRVQHFTEQLALVAVLDLLLQQQPQVSLIVLDSATFHFRQGFTDAAQRSRLLLAMAQQLAQVAEQRGVAIVMVNQVVTRVAADAAAPSGAAGGAGGGGGGLLAPALGEGWGQAASCRVALFWEGPQRYAMVTKAKHVPVEQPAAGQQQQQAAAASSMCVPYYVGPGGIM